MASVDPGSGVGLELSQFNKCWFFKWLESEVRQDSENMNSVFFRRHLIPLMSMALLCGHLGGMFATCSRADDPPARSIADELGLPTVSGPAGKPVKVSATFYVAPGERRARRRRVILCVITS